MHLKLKLRQGYKFQEAISRDMGHCRSEAGADRTVFFPWAFRTNSTGCSLADMSALRWSRLSIEIPEISVLTPGHSNVIHSLGCFASKRDRENQSAAQQNHLSLVNTVFYSNLPWRGSHLPPTRAKAELAHFFALKQKDLNKSPETFCIF